MTGHAANDIPADFKSTLPPRKRAKTQEEKEQRRIERILRNRKAAHQSREKKRLHLMYLEKKCTLLERIISKLDLNKITETMTDPTLTKAVSEYEAFVKEGSGSSSGLDMSEQELEKSGKNSSESSMFSANSALSAATTPSVKSPSMSGTTPGSPCTTVGSDSGGYERQSLSVLEDAGSVSKTEPLFSSDSYSYGGTTYHPSYGMPDESDPRALSSTRTSNNESWNLLLTQSHDYPVGDGNSYRDDVIEALEMTDSSVELDHWRNPAEVVQWEGEN